MEETELLTTLRNLQQQVEAMRKELGEMNVKADRMIASAKAGLDKLDKL